MRGSPGGWPAWIVSAVNASGLTITREISKSQVVIYELLFPEKNRGCSLTLNVRKPLFTGCEAHGIEEGRRKQLEYRHFPTGFLLPTGHEVKTCFYHAHSTT